MRNERVIELVGRVLGGNATPAEWEALDLLLRTNADARRFYSEQAHADLWLKKTLAPAKRRYRLPAIWRVAAGLTILCGLSYATTTFINNGASNTTDVSPKNLELTHHGNELFVEPLVDSGLASAYSSNDGTSDASDSSTQLSTVQTINLSTNHTQTGDNEMNTLTNLVAAITTAALTAGSTSASILLQDGAPIGVSGYYGSNAATGNRDLKADAVTTNSVFGFSTNTWQNGGTSVVNVFPESRGLQFSALFTGYGIVASGGGFGLCSAGGPSGEVRTQWKSLATGLFNGCEKVYFRTLMRMDTASLGVLDNANKYFGVGLTRTAVNGALTATGAGLWFAVQKNAVGLTNIVLRTGSSALMNYELCPVSANMTYLCVAEVAIGAGGPGVDRIRAFAIPVEEYLPSTQFNENIGVAGVVEAAVLSGALPVTYLAVGGPYQTANGYAVFDEVAIATEYSNLVPVASEIPMFEAAALVKANDEFALSAHLRQGTATVLALSTDATGIVVTNETAGTIAAGVDTLIPLEGLSPDVTYSLAAWATNEYGSTRMQAGVFYNGALVIEKLADAHEEGLMPGRVMVSRASPGAALSVHYSFVGGTAIENQTYAIPSGTVIIPEGEVSAIIEIDPLFDAATTTDTTLTVALSEGMYLLEGTESVGVTVVNWTPSPEYNYWIAKANADQRASTAANWSQGVPTSTSKIFLGSVSSQDLIWDGGNNGLTDVVAGWEQSSDYQGSVVIATTYPEYNPTFNRFVVTGNCTINGGSLSHTSHGISTNRMYRLMIEVKGNLTVGEGAVIDVTARGRRSNFDGFKKSAPHGGSSAEVAYAAFGSVLAPIETGWGACAGTGSTREANGGGAICLLVDGDFICNGMIRADSGFEHEAGGAGGSIWIRAKNIRGNGRYSADGKKGSKSDGCNAVGAGGRIALAANEVNETPLDNLSAIGQHEGWGIKTAAGTFYLASATSAVITVRNYTNDNNSASSGNLIATPIPAVGDGADFRACTLHGGVSSHLEMTRSLVLDSIILDQVKRVVNWVEQNCSATLNLNGKTVRVKSATIYGTKLPFGEYTKASLESQFPTLAGALLDTSATVDTDGTGVLSVVAPGTVFLLQ